MSESASTSTDPAAPQSVSRLRVWFWRAAILAWLGVLAFALHSLQHEWSSFHMRDLNAAFARLGWSHLGMALAFTAISYFSNAAIDLFSLRWLGKKVPIGKALGYSYIAAAFSLNAGGTLLGGGGVRMRLYTSLGLTSGEVARMTGFAAIVGWQGNAAVAGALLCIAPSILPWLSPWVTQCLGAVLLIAVGAIVGYGAWRRRKSADSETWPPTSLVAGAVIAAAMDWLMAGLAIRALLPGHLGEITTAGFLGVVLISQMLGAMSHVPGGVGVLELSVTKLVGAALPSAWLAAALMSYRLIYYLVPFAIAAAWMGGREMWAHRSKVTRGMSVFGNVWKRLGPGLGTLLALVGGFILMLSANSPIEPNRRAWLSEAVPLPVVETSHFLSSIAGFALIIAARGLQRRVHAAWWAAVLLSSAGMIFSLLKGIDYEEALIMAFVLACLLPYRRYFHRHAALWSRRFTLEWWILLAALTMVSVWLGFLTSRHVHYRHGLWLQFSFEGDASRFLRGQVGIAIVLIGILLAQWFRPAPPRLRAQPVVETPERWARIHELVNRAPHSQAHLALLGDKMFHFSESGDAFLMYGQQGRSRIVMGDPVGNEEAWDDLLWSFNEAAEDEGLRVCYYQVSADTVPLFVDMGMRLFKLGEEARIHLPDFSLESASARRLRQARNRAQRDGATFVIWPASEVGENLSSLRKISDEWLAKHSAREKGFSLGRLDDDYLRQGPVAVVIKNGEVCAFANLWGSETKEELSIDLMRHGSQAPSGVMDYLFTELFIWGKEQGYQWFSLGMAPLSGMAAHPLAPLWQKLGSLIYQRGGAFYNFQGLRDFKEKFHPDWESRYLVVPGAWHLPAALSDITALIGGGWRGVIGRSRA